MARIAAVAAAALAVLAGWPVARYVSGVPLHAPAFAASGSPAAIPLGFAVAVAVLAGLAGWALTGILHRKASRPRRIWVSVSLTALAAPLSGHGITAADRSALVCLHLLVAA